MRLTLCLLNTSESLQIKISRSGTPGRGSIFEERTNKKQRKVSDLPSGNWDTNNVHERRTRLTTQGNVDNKNNINLIPSLT